VIRRGDVVIRQRRPWSPTVVRLLKHLQERGFTAAPRPIGSGFDDEGNELLTFIEGDPPPVRWSAEAIFAVGALLRGAHEAAADFPIEGDWMPWWGRDLPTEDLIVGHCDVAPWNFLAAHEMPVALLDWDTAGPVGRQLDVAQAAWLNVQLHDDDIAAAKGLPEPAERAVLLRTFCEGYRLDGSARSRLIPDMIEIAIRTAAQEAIDGGVKPSSSAPVQSGRLGGGPGFDGQQLLWAVTWRVRAARWMLEHRLELERVLST
jgi:Ser/Thr protein kinase RdoA (MazF antagonist)